MAFEKLSGLDRADDDDWTEIEESLNDLSRPPGGPYKIQEEEKAYPEKKLESTRHTPSVIPSFLLRGVKIRSDWAW
jgi:hypothetical protein